VQDWPSGYEFQYGENDCNPSEYKGMYKDFKIDVEEDSKALRKEREKYDRISPGHRPEECMD